MGIEKTSIIKKIGTLSQDGILQQENENGLEQQITTNAKRLENVFQQVQSNSDPGTAVVAPSDLPNVSRLGLENSELTKIKEKHIIAEIELLKSGKSVISNIPAESRREILQSELESGLAELQETLSFVRSQHKELKADIEREEETNKQLNSVSEALQKRHQQLEEEAGDTNSVEKCKQELQEKIDKAEEYMKSCKKKLGSFIGKHFPLPSEQIFNDVKKKLRSADIKMTRSNTLTLKKILEELISKCIDDPNDSYVTIDHRYWPPYVELLLRCHIVLRHPDDPQRIKLVPFHL